MPTDAKSTAIYLDDEPADVDSLGRAQQVTALAHMARTCNTPMVIGIYGGWGVGKTSLMKQIKKELSDTTNTDNDRILTLEFESWQHQYDNNPIAALLQTMLVKFEKDTHENVKNYMKTVLRAFTPELKLGSWLPISVKINNIKEIYSQVLEENFQARSDRIRLRDTISKLVHEVSSNGEYRIVCFIDDLDRCAPDVAVGMLDAIKIYLNIRGCVFVLGLDHGRITDAILKKHNDPEYLDKIVQIYWDILPTDLTYANAFVATNLVGKRRGAPRWMSGTHDCIPIIASTFADNPRAMIRFINQLIAYRSIAERQPGLFAGGYDERITCALLLLRLHNKDIFKEIVCSSTPYAIMQDLMRREPLYVDKNIKDGIDTRLLSFIQKLYMIGRENDLRNYIILSRGLTLPAPIPDIQEVEVPKGTFERKWRDDRGKECQHTINISSFIVGACPVTVGEYAAFTSDTGYNEPHKPLFPQGDNHPVVGVTWNDAKTYAEWLKNKTGNGYRLLSEPEWEYCCRAGSKTDFAWGDDIDHTKANYGDEFRTTTPVDMYQPNKFGLYDMHGNVWEWVEDVAHASYTDAPTDGSAWLEGGEQGFRVLRGGSWGKLAVELKASHRHIAPEEEWADDIGFRICRSVNVEDGADRALSPEPHDVA